MNTNTITQETETAEHICPGCNFPQSQWKWNGELRIHAGRVYARLVCLCRAMASWEVK